LADFVEGGIVVHDQVGLVFGLCIQQGNGVMDFRSGFARVLHRVSRLVHADHGVRLFPEGGRNAAHRVVAVGGVQQARPQQEPGGQE
jgi:hypothetical protein